MAKDYSQALQWLTVLNAPAVTGDALYAMIVLGVLPFNVIKGVIITVITILLFSRMKTWIEQQRVKLMPD